LSTTLPALQEFALWNGDAHVHNTERRHRWAITSHLWQDEATWKYVIFSR